MLVGTNGVEAGAVDFADRAVGYLDGRSSIELPPLRLVPVQRAGVVKTIDGRDRRRGVLIVICVVALHDKREFRFALQRYFDARPPVVTNRSLRFRMVAEEPSHRARPSLTSDGKGEYAIASSLRKLRLAGVDAHRQRSPGKRSPDEELHPHVVGVRGHGESVHQHVVPGQEGLDADPRVRKTALGHEDPGACVENLFGRVDSVGVDPSSHDVAALQQVQHAAGRAGPAIRPEPAGVRRAVRPVLVARAGPHGARVSD